MIAFLLFYLSLIPLKLGASGNRILVLLPFVVLSVGLLMSRLFSRKNVLIKGFSIVFIILIIISQCVETSIWFKLKLDPDIRGISSDWIVKNIKQGTVIGLENIPIYQKIPNVLLKEFYLAQYHKTHNFIYKYKIIDSKSKNLPSVIVLINSDLEYNYVIKSSKNDLIRRLNKENYKIIKKFEPNIKYFHFIANQLDIDTAALAPIPLSISIYEK